MDYRRIQLFAKNLLGNDDGTAIALGVKPRYKFDDGKPTDVVEALIVEVVATDNNYEKMMIKVFDLKAPISQELIAQAGGHKKVKFKNLTGKLYRTANGDLAVSASATTLEVLA